MAGMYERYANDISEDLFNSIYDDLREIATKSQKEIYTASKKRRGQKYHVGEAQEKFSLFCTNKLSLGDALDFIKSHGIYHYNVMNIMN